MHRCSWQAKVEQMYQHIQMHQVQSGVKFHLSLAPESRQHKTIIRFTKTEGVDSQIGRLVGLCVQPNRMPGAFHAHPENYVK
jgi:hypothetical protein